MGKMQICKLTPTEILSKTTTSKPVWAERLLVVPLGVTHKILAAGNGKIYEVYPDIQLINTNNLTVDQSFSDIDNMLDYDDTTCSQSSTSWGDGDLAAVDLGEVREVAVFIKLNAYSSNGGRRTITVLISDVGGGDANNWHTIASQTGNGMFQWFGIVKTRFIKIHIDHLDGNGHSVCIHAFEAYDYKNSDNILSLNEDEPFGELTVKHINGKTNIIVLPNSYISYRILEFDPCDKEVIEIEVIK